MIKLVGLTSNQYYYHTNTSTSTTTATNTVRVRVEQLKSLERSLCVCGVCVWGGGREVNCCAPN